MGDGGGDDAGLVRHDVVAEELEWGGWGGEVVYVGWGA